MVAGGRPLGRRGRRRPLRAGDSTLPVLPAPRLPGAALNPLTAKGAAAWDAGDRSAFARVAKAKQVADVLVERVGKDRFAETIADLRGIALLRGDHDARAVLEMAQKLAIVRHGIPFPSGSDS